MVSPCKALERAGGMELDFSHTLTGGRAGFPALMDALEGYFAARGAPEAGIGALMVAVDEVVSNILNHGGEHLRIEVRAGADASAAWVEVEDDGPAFDPTVAAAPDTGLPVEDRDIGGLGIHLVRKLANEVAYERRGARNRLRFSKTFRS
jgi:serine/threonine-protein kinase RsbW